MIFYTKFDENSNRRIEHEFAYSLLSEALRTRFGINSFTVERDAGGKPFLAEYPDIKFNISHCSGLAVCGISDAEIGVDAELVRTYNVNAIKRIFSEEEAKLVEASEKPDYDFFRIWTLKECFGKYLGKGLFPGISEYSFDLSGERPICVQAAEAVFTQSFIDKKWLIGVCSDKPELDFIFIAPVL